MSMGPSSVRRALLGSAAALAMTAALAAPMFALRSHLGTAAPALVLVVPVIAGVILGGRWGGVATVLAGFLVYDLGFIPPYGTLSVGRDAGWVALFVYAVVAALVGQVAGSLWHAQATARHRSDDAERLFEASQLLVSERPLPELLELIVSSVQESFDLESVVVLLPQGDTLSPSASAGKQLSESELALLTPGRGVTAALAAIPAPHDGGTRLEARSVALAAAGRPVGLLVLVGRPLSRREYELLETFGNQIALAVERAQLREQTVRMGVLEEADRLRRALIGAVSHDLRTPLATIKASTSTLLDPSHPLPAEQADELLRLVDSQADRLGRLVSNLLDMSRIQSGSLVLHRQLLGVAELVDGAVHALGPSVAARVSVAVAPGVTTVVADRVLLTEVLVNLVENAARFAPEGSPVEVEASASHSWLRITVSDRGPGVPLVDRDGIFDRPRRATSASSGEGAGLGLTIVKSFVEAHFGRVFVEDAPGGGARFGFEIPASPGSALEAERALDPY